MKHYRLILLTFVLLCLPKMVVAQMQPVDLGLSVKWASCNLGASSPEEYGDYYAWGETETKKVYDWKTYRFWDQRKYGFIKYNYQKSSGGIYYFVDNKTILELDDDAAHVILGGVWRIPRIDEIKELVRTKTKDDYRWEWKAINGHNGWLITYLKNNESIFFPAAGFWRMDKLEVCETEGLYWSSSLGIDNPRSAFYWGFSSHYVETDYYPDRVVGLTIRPVAD